MARAKNRANHRRSPCVQDRGHSDPGTQMLRTGGDGQQRPGGCREQEAVDRGFVLIGNVGNERRQREDHMEVLHRQQVRGPRLHPLPRCGPLALRAMAIAARVVGDLLMAAIGSRLKL